jgi:predicted ATP-grasp superfamily ATP-dependent carboligase
VIAAADFLASVYVSGKDFSINFLKTSVIINFNAGQYIKDVNPKDYEFLLEGNRI